MKLFIVLWGFLGIKLGLLGLLCCLFLFGIGLRLDVMCIVVCIVVCGSMCGSDVWLRCVVRCAFHLSDGCFPVNGSVFSDKSGIFALLGGVFLPALLGGSSLTCFDGWDIPACFKKI